MIVAINRPGYDDVSPREFVKDDDLELLRQDGLILEKNDNDLKYDNANRRPTNPNPNKDVNTPMALLTWIDCHTLQMVLFEGKKCQIRWLFWDVLQVELMLLEQVGIGEIRIKNLPIGKCHLLSEWEIKLLL